MIKGFPCGSAGKESACNAGDLGSIPALGKSPGEGESYALQYSGLETGLYSPQGYKELDMTERLSLYFLQLDYITQVMDTQNLPLFNYFIIP